MNKGKEKRWIAAVLAMVMMFMLLSGCVAEKDREDAETITVYLWSNALYDEYARYIQSQLPDINIEFVVGTNDLDFYRFMNEHGELPDIITCRRFSLYDAAALKDQLMDLSTTEEAGAIYDTYIQNFTNTDGTINWLPLCGEVDGIVANRALFEEYGIPLPTDYDSFVSACRQFEEVGIRGFTADFTYDYTCMEILQGWSIPEIVSMEGQVWRSGYEDPASDITGLDEVIWPGVFERMEQFIEDANIHPGDIELSYDPVVNMFNEGQVAMIRAVGSYVVAMQNMGVDAVMLPYFGQDGEQWLLTYPAFQVALNKDLEQDVTRKENALRVLSVMLSEEGQNALANGEDVITYSQNVSLNLSPYLENLTPLIQQNHMYIRIASNDFFAVSRDVVSRMIQREYNAEQAYDAFQAQLTNPAENNAETVLTLEQGYSNIFHTNGGNEAYSAMAHSLRECYGSDVVIAPACSFTGVVLQADYTEKQVGNMIMPNSLEAWQCEMSGAELRECIRMSVEGTESGFVPFNRGSLPTVSGISIEVQETEEGYLLLRVLKDGREIADEDIFRVAFLNLEPNMTPFFENENLVFEKMEERVKNAWIAYITGGGTVAAPENYITVK